MALRGAILAAVFAAAAAVPSDLNVWLADPSRPGSPPLEDQCYARTAFGTSDAAAGCGIQIAKDGVAVTSNYQEEVTFIANARNALFITTNTWNDADVGSSTQMNISIALQVSSETSDGVVLCPKAAVLREGYNEGLNQIPISGLDDPSSPRSDATMWSTPQGNSLFVIPYTLRQVREPDPTRPEQHGYPQLTIVLIPKLVTQNIHDNCTATEAGVLECFCETPGYVIQADDSCMYFESETLDPIEFTVNVRTEPLLETLRDEVVQNCDFAYSNDLVTKLGDADFLVSSAPSPAARAPGWRLAAGFAAAALLHGAQRRKGPR